MDRLMTDHISPRLSSQARKTPWMAAWDRVARLLYRWGEGVKSMPISFVIIGVPYVCRPSLLPGHLSLSVFTSVAYRDLFPSHTHTPSSSPTFPPQV